MITFSPKEYSANQSILDTKESLKKISEQDWLILVTIAQAVGGDFGMQVKLGEPGEGSFFSFDTKSITVDPEHLIISPYLAKYIVAHEGAHRAISRSPLDLGFSEQETNQLYSELGFGYLQNIIEDPAVNNWMRERYPGLKEIVKQVFDEMLQEDNTPMVTSEVRRIVRSLGYIPRFVQYGSEIFRYWHQERFSSQLDPMVRNALDRTINYAQQSYRSIPDPKRGLEEEELTASAKFRFENNTSNIWPVFKELVNQDLKTEALRQMIQDLWQNRVKRAEFDGLPDFDNLPESVKNEIEQAINQTIKNLNNKIQETLEQIEDAKRKHEELSELINDIQQRLEQATGEEKEHLEQLLKEKIAEQLNQRNKQLELEKNLQDLQDTITQISFGDYLPYPEHQFSEETIRELQKLFEMLPRPKQSEYRERAQGKLKELEDLINEELYGKLTKRVESHRERREKEKIEEKERAARLRGEVAKKCQEILQTGATEYDKAYQEVADIITQLYNRLIKIFIKERHPRWQAGYSFGERPDMSKAMQAEADPRYLHQIWQRKTIPNKPGFRFSILVDLSGSMRGKKIEETFKGLVVLAEVLERLGVQYEINGFQDEIINYKSFLDQLDNRVREKLSVAKREPYNKGYHNQSQWNSDGYCLNKAYGSLKQNLGKHNFLIVLSDGLPVPRYDHRVKDYSLETIVSRIQQDGRVKLIGIGLGPDTEHVKNYYPISIPNVRVRVTEKERLQGLKDFVESFADLLERIITNPETF